MRQFETILSESIPSNAFIMIVLKSFSDREKYLNYKRAALGMLFVCFIWSFLVYFSLNKKIEDFFYIAPFLILAIILLALISEEK